MDKSILPRDYGLPALEATFADGIERDAGRRVDKFG